jgi:HD-GYP domain-containing protein (c-di-GMP phosphodiesterase class II)
LGIGAMLHDVGKIGLSEDVRRHHEIHPDPDDPAMLEEYHSHVRAGYDLLFDTGIPATARNIVLNHHQRFNGRGWPVQSRMEKGVQRGLLEREGIHIFSRIVAAANTLDNLLTDAEGRHYPPVAALREFASPRFDGWFDPTVRDLMVRRIPPFPIGSLIKLSDGRSAVVVTPNFDQPCRPVVRLLDEFSKRDDGEHCTLDLTDMSPDLVVRECAGRRVDEYLFKLPPRARRVISWTSDQPPAA